MDVKSVIPGESVTGGESKGRERSEKKLDSGEQRNLLKVREVRRIWRVLHPQMKAASEARKEMMVKILIM